MKVDVLLGLQVAVRPVSLKVKVINGPKLKLTGNIPAVPGDLHISIPVIHNVIVALRHGFLKQVDIGIAEGFSALAVGNPINHIGLILVDGTKA